jgi:KaiC/GvpD/RAD55 family RecA-like ATPase
MPRIPLIEDLTKEAIPAGYTLLVEFDPASEWYSSSITMAAGWIETGGDVAYNVHAHPPENIRSHFNRLGLKVEELEDKDELRIFDWYTASLGQKSKEKHANQSMKVADLSIDFAKKYFVGPPRPNTLIIDDTLSPGTRFNDEKAWFEFLLTRIIPMASIRKMTKILGLTIGVHNEWGYKTLESVVDGIIDFKLDEATNPPRSIMRIRRLREVSYDPGWHPLTRTAKFEFTLEK